jgi:osmotically-inducible protein OsmY
MFSPINKIKMRTNEALQQDVQNALKWEPLLHAAEIGVSVNSGVVTLTGMVDNYAKKSEAESAAKNVLGVTAVIEKIEVHFAHTDKKEDSDIAPKVVSALKWNWAVPSDSIKVKVEKGWVTLEGQMNWQYQKDAAKKAVKNVDGVKGVLDLMVVKSQSKDAIEQTDIEQALARNWSIDDKAVHVNVLGNNVTLKGTVHSLYQKEEASRIAWKAPGVWDVDNQLRIEYNY